MIKLVLLRHGQSTWNLEKKFTGWTDVPLTEKGILQAKTAGKLLKEERFSFDIAFTSVLIRAQDTLKYCLEELGQNVSTVKNWRLNERHYGDLQGLNKKKMAEKVGEEQVHIWRRSFDVAPPALSEDDERHPRFDPKYSNLIPEELPATESLKDCIARVLPYWNSEIVPKLKEGKQVIIAAHGNSLRALVKHLDNISDEDITGLTIPTGVPLVYELDDDLKPIKHYYLGDQEEIAKKIEADKNQGKA